MLNQQILRTPGPTPIPNSVERAMIKPMVGGRETDFEDVYDIIKPKLKQLFGTKEDVLILSGSGTSALEAAAINTCSKDDEVVVIVTGGFGDRFAEICETFNLNVHRLNIPWGEAVTIEQLDKFIKNKPNLKAIFITYCETSTGILNPLKEISEYINNSSDALIIVDGVSCIGGAPIELDNWGVDICVTSSQKALMTPPGLALLAISKRAWRIIERTNQPRFYFDLRKYKKRAIYNQTPFSPPVSLIHGLDEALNLLLEEGLENVFKRHELMSKMTRSAIKALNLNLLTTDIHASPTVTAIKPKNLDINLFRKDLKERFGLIITGVPKKLKGQVFRIGHMGHCYPADVLQYISLIEISLQKMGADIELGKGIQAALQCYLDNIGD